MTASRSALSTPFSSDGPPAMTEGNGRIAALRASLEQERVGASVSRCEDQLRRARELARGAGEGLRRAHREVRDAEAALDDAARRRDRMVLPS
jgi:hypothetical protein